MQESFFYSARLFLSTREAFPSESSKAHNQAIHNFVVGKGAGKHADTERSERWLRRVVLPSFRPRVAVRRFCGAWAVRRKPHVEILCFRLTYVREILCGVVVRLLFSFVWCWTLVSLAECISSVACYGFWRRCEISYKGI